MNKLVPCAWLSSGALEVWILRFDYEPKKENKQRTEESGRRERGKEPVKEERERRKAGKNEEVLDRGKARGKEEEKEGMKELISHPSNPHFHISTYR